MKLHLPKLLLAAILIAAGSSAFAKDYTVTNSTTSLTAFRDSRAGDTVTFNMTVGEDTTNPGDNVYLHDSRNGNYDTLSGNATINENVILTNGYSGSTYNFKGSVTGTGDFQFTGTKGGDNQTYTFNGDMSGYSGDMKIGDTKYGTFSFNNTTIGSATAAGSITAKNAASRVNLNNSTSYASINTATLGISGTSAVNAAVTINDKLDVSGITSAIGGSGTVTLDSATINVSSAQFNNGNVNLDIFGSGLTVTGEEAATITVDGVALNNRDTATWTGGTLKLVDVIWNGGENAATWNTSTECWTVDGSATAFMQNDRVRFNSSANLGLDGNINVHSVTVSGEGTTVTLNNTSTGNLIVGSSIAIEDGATLVLDKETGGTGLVQGVVTVKEGGTLKFNAHDVTGYNGGASSLHTLNVNKGGSVFQSNASNENFAGTLNLEGSYDGVDNSQLDMFGDSARIVVGNDNESAAINVKLCLRRDNASISVGNNSTLTVSKAISVGAKPDNAQANGIIAKTGAGLLKATGAVNINGVNVNAGGVEFRGGGSVGAITMGATNTSLSFNGTNKTYTAGVITMQAQDSTTRDLSVGSGATLNASAINNNWGMRNITVDGTLNLVHGEGAAQTGAFVISSGVVTTTIGGNGTINAYALKVGNVGTYNITVHELNIGEGGWTKSASTLTTVHIKNGSTVNSNGLANAIKANVEGGTLNFNGGVTGSSTIFVTGGELNFNGGDTGSTILVTGGELNMDSAAATTKVTMEGGTFNINDTAHEHSFAMIDGASGGGRGAGTVNFKAGTTSSVGQLWGNKDKAAFVLEKNAKVKLANDTVTVTGLEGSSSIASTKEVGDTGGSLYSAAGEDWDINGASVSVNGVANNELKNKLVGSSLVNESENAVTATNTASTYNAIEAKGNDITIRTTDAGTTAQSLYVGVGRTVTFANADGTATGVTLGKSAEIYGSVNGGISWTNEGETNTLTLNAVYNDGNSILTTIAQGSTIDFKTDGRIVLGEGEGKTDNLQAKNLTLTATITLDSSANEAYATRWLIAGKEIWYRDNWENNKTNTLVNFDTFAIKESTGKELIRYANATSLDDEWTLYGGATTAALGDPIKLGAGAYRYVATADGGIGVQYYQKNVPEPTTATLSLLALAALAARRRRKN